MRQIPKQLFSRYINEFVRYHNRTDLSIFYYNNYKSVMYKDNFEALILVVTSLENRQTHIYSRNCISDDDINIIAKNITQKTIVTSSERIKRHLIDLGFKCVDYNDDDYNEHLNPLYELHSCEPFILHKE